MDSEEQTTADVPPKKTAQVPSVGSMVHYVSADGLNYWPGIVTKVYEAANPFGKLDLIVFAGNFTAYCFGIRHKAIEPNTRYVKTWHWPPFVPPVEVSE